MIISQRKYVLDILEEIGMLDCKLVDTLMDPNVKFVPGQGEPLRDRGRYRRLIGKLNYLTITQPNISFPKSVASQLLQSPCDYLGCCDPYPSVISKEHWAREYYMKTEIIPRLLDIVIQTGQVHPQTDAPL